MRPLCAEEMAMYMACYYLAANLISLKSDNINNSVCSRCCHFSFSDSRVSSLHLLFSRLNNKNYASTTYHERKTAWLNARCIFAIPSKSAIFLPSYFPTSGIKTRITNNTLTILTDVEYCCNNIWLLLCISLIHRKKY